MKGYIALAAAICAPMLIYFGLGWPRWSALILWLASGVVLLIYSFVRPAVEATREG